MFQKSLRPFFLCVIRLGTPDYADYSFIIRHMIVHCTSSGGNSKFIGEIYTC